MHFDVDELKEKICKLEEEKQQYEQIQNQMKFTGQSEVSLVDPDSRLMRVDSQRLEVGYNIQTSVDAKQHLIVDYDVINNSTDHHQLTKDALAAKQNFGSLFSNGLTAIVLADWLHLLRN